ncbi:MAG: hypothetical protein KY464_13580 [Gemmatimonadetes bacterium]|nr:hypothetical protein [Gemmatimonadota bacterium]
MRSTVCSAPAALTAQGAQSFRTLENTSTRHSARTPVSAEAIDQVGRRFVDGVGGATRVAVAGGVVSRT